MACTGCDARKEWAKRTAHLAAQTLAVMLRLKQPTETKPPLPPTEQHPDKDSAIPTS